MNNAAARSGTDRQTDRITKQPLLVMNMNALHVPRLMESYVSPLIHTVSLRSPLLHAHARAPHAYNMIPKISQSGLAVAGLTLILCKLTANYSETSEKAFRIKDTSSHLHRMLV